MPAGAHKPLGARDYVGLALFASSLAFEAIAGIYNIWQPNREHDFLIIIIVSFVGELQTARSRLGVKQRTTRNIRKSSSQKDFGLSAVIQSEWSRSF